jgi:hypothetical protein
MLMLLLVALVASLTAWRIAVNQRKQVERDVVRAELEYELEQLESHRGFNPLAETPGYKAHVSELRNKIDALQP